MGGILERISPPKFNPERDIPDLTGKVIIVTGGNTGIGYETVKQLLLKNAKVYLAARSAEKANTAIEALRAETSSKGTAVFLALDLSDLESVKKAAAEFLEKDAKLDVLINNACVFAPSFFHAIGPQLRRRGVMNSPRRHAHEAGLRSPCVFGEFRSNLQLSHLTTEFGTNVIGHYLFTTLLLPALRSASTETIPARVVHVSSAAHPFAPGRGIEFVSIKDGEERNAWVKKNEGFMLPWRLYGQSKIGNIYLGNYFARTYPEFLVSCSLHPGAIRSELGRHTAGVAGVLNSVFSFALKPTPMGAITQLWAATVAAPSEITGQYLVPWGRVAKPDKRALDEKLEEEMIVYVKEVVRDYT
ncbi:Short-chain dehydrogenase/reductase family protein [Mycena chlorophos]|uniref:Short-chain dehydrogenase/reductase family protein n=1 Tax=Mycena chlorophos TaxID=658473 RepID=A0A8H6SB76_MYCCL|nr:Short-chain dehydrogenase/reductase family protein [Mycena chlorophos]